jgi:hypothetical protein
LYAFQLVRQAGSVWTLLWKEIYSERVKTGPPANKTPAARFYADFERFYR